MDYACHLIHQAYDTLLEDFGGISEVSDVAKGEDREHLVSFLLPEIKYSRVALDHLGYHSSTSFPVAEHQELRYLKQTLFDHLDLILEALLQTLNRFLLELSLALYPALVLVSARYTFLSRSIMNLASLFFILTFHHRVHAGNLLKFVIADDDHGIDDYEPDLLKQGVEWYDDLLLYVPLYPQHDEEYHYEVPDVGGEAQGRLQ